MNFYDNVLFQNIFFVGQAQMGRPIMIIPSNTINCIFDNGSFVPILQQLFDISNSCLGCEPDDHCRIQNRNIQ